MKTLTILLGLCASIACACADGPSKRAVKKDPTCDTAKVPEPKAEREIRNEGYLDCPNAVYILQEENTGLGGISLDRAFIEAINRANRDSTAQPPSDAGRDVPDQTLRR